MLKEMDGNTMKIPFYKMSGSGNDFILIDNREGMYDDFKTPAFVSAVCARSVSIGADGLIFIENSDACDYKWCFYNSDGSDAEMCGNGARCAARFAVLNKIAGETHSFETTAGMISAEVRGAVVKIRLSEPGALETGMSLSVDETSVNLSSINTGVPHVIVPVADIENVPVQTLGRKIRFHLAFQPAGTNVNFIALDKEGVVHIRTYERGVEDETLACGTGAVAAALAAVATGKAVSPVRVRTRSSEMLTVYVEDTQPPFKTVFLEGGARVVYAGEIWEEAYK